MAKFWNFQWVENDKSFSVQYPSIVDDSLQRKNFTLAELNKDPGAYNAFLELQKFAESVAENHDYKLDAEDMENHIQSHEKQLEDSQEKIKRLRDMATKIPKKAIDLLLLTVERAPNIPYIEIEPDFRSDGGASKALVVDTFNKVKASIDAGRKDEVEGVLYVTTKAAPIVGVVYIEIEDADAAILKDGQAWINEIAAEIGAGIPNSKLGQEGRRQGYTGIQISWP